MPTPHKSDLNNTNINGNDKNNNSNSNKSIKNSNTISSILNPTSSTKKKSLNDVENFMVRVNWFYRPRDISRRANDSRLLYATMHSDICPLQSIRGKCTIKHKSDIENLTTYRKLPHHFWFDKLYDKYMIRLYDVLLSKDAINMPKNYYNLLIQRCKYIFIENGKGKELISKPKTCINCDNWCSPDDSIQCVDCKKTYHMNCLNPPLLKKPSRGFGWSCAACNKKFEDKLQENLGLTSSRTASILKQVSSDILGGDDDDEDKERDEEIDDELQQDNNQKNLIDEEIESGLMSKYQILEEAYKTKLKPLSKEQIHLLNMWPSRYQGMHSTFEDILEVDSRIFPKAVTRIGPKHQVNEVIDWPGRSVIYYESKKKKSGKRGGAGGRKKTTGNTNYHDYGSNSATSLKIAEATKKVAKIIEENGEKPPWFQEKPFGYIERGGDDTSTLMWKVPSNLKNQNQIDIFLKKAEPQAEKLNIIKTTPNFIDKCLKDYMDCNYNEIEALEKVSKYTRKSLKEPTFSKIEKKRFEEAVKLHGSELHPVHQYVKTQSSANIVRYYYLWKKTPNGWNIWGNYDGRKKKKKNPKLIEKEIESSSTSPLIIKDEIPEIKYKGLVDNVANSDDDSDYDLNKAKKVKRNFICKHCKTTKSIQWKRAPGYPIAESDPIIALCFRCARLWRLYAVLWEDPQDVTKKMNQRGGGGWKRKLEEELVEDAISILSERDQSESSRKRYKSNGSKSDNNNDNKRSSSDDLSDDSKRKCIKTSSSIIEKRSSANSSISPVPVVKTRRRRKRVKSEIEVNKNGKKEKEKKKPRKRSKQIKDYGIESSVSMDLDEDDENTESELDPSSITVTTDEHGLVESKVKLESEQEQVLQVEQEHAPYTPSMEKVFDGNRTPNSSSPLMNASSKDIYEKRPYKQRTFTSQLRTAYKLPFEPSQRPCSVCRTIEPINKMLICNNCGVNVHTYCYGCKDIDATEPRKWICDICSNDIYPSLPTLYSCVLCPARETDHDKSIHGDIKAIPDALKRTFDNNWCHVLCALYQPLVKFGNSDTLQPICGIHRIPISVLNHRCCICETDNGACSSCDICNHKFHIGCAQKEKYVLGFSFTLLKSLSNENKSEKEKKEQSKFIIKFGNELGLLKPVSICPDHKDYRWDKFYPFNAIDNDGTSIMELYLKIYKTEENFEPGCLGRAKAFKEVEKEIKNLNLNLDLDLNDQLQIKDELTETKFNEINNKTPIEKKCIECDCDISPIWWPVPNNHDENSPLQYSFQFQCHKCYCKHKMPEKYEELYNIPLIDIIKSDQKSLCSKVSELFKNNDINHKSNGNSNGNANSNIISTKTITNEISSN